jgi:hypothetical protein
MSGYIRDQGIFISSDTAQGYHRWEDFHAIRTTRQCLLLSGENWRLVSVILPWTSFRDPAAAQEAMHSVVQQRKRWRPIPVGDPRLLASPDDAPLFQPPGPHVAFDGEVSFRQIARSVPGKKLSRAMHGWILVIVVLLLFVALTLLGGLSTVLLFGFPLLVLAIAIVVQLLRHPLLRGNQDRAAFRLRGWFVESGFFLQSVTGQSLRQWGSVAGQWHDDTMLCICLPGANEAWFFFSRHQFTSSEDFQQACRWAEAGLSEPAVET